MCFRKFEPESLHPHEARVPIGKRLHLKAEVESAEVSKKGRCERIRTGLGDKYIN